MKNRTRARHGGEGRRRGHTNGRGGGFSNCNAIPAIPHESSRGETARILLHLLQGTAVEQGRCEQGRCGQGRCEQPPLIRSPSREMINTHLSSQSDTQSVTRNRHRGNRKRLKLGSVPLMKIGIRLLGCRLPRPTLSESVSYL